VVDFTPIESPGTTEGKALARAERLRLLPSVDSPDRSDSFRSLRDEAALILLPVTPVQSLALHIRRLQPDLVLIASKNFSTASWRHDLSLREALSTVPAILLTSVVNSSTRQRAAELGIASVLPQDLKLRQLLTAIQAAAAGLAVAFQPASDQTAEYNSADEKSLRDVPLVEHLTPREAAVLALMAHGRGNKEIAAQLNISEHTAKFHVSSILAKLGATSRTEAVTIGILCGLVAI